jgi:hypothetical protein
MASSGTLPGFDAVPALMSPGYAWPGEPYGGTVGPGPRFSAGTIYADWQPDIIYAGWQPGDMKTS